MTLERTSPAQSVPNLRITFWGIQGSCPIFPTREEVDEYAQRIAAIAIERTLDDLVKIATPAGLTLQSLQAMRAAGVVAEPRKVPLLPVYGGDTTCVEVDTADGNILLFDMGTGIREFSKSLLARPLAAGGRTLHVFGSHEHLDHRNGLPFAGFCFEKAHPFQVHVYGTHRFLKTLDDRFGIYSHRITEATHVDDPIDYRMFSATFTGSEIRDAARLVAADAGPFDWPIFETGKPISIGMTEVTPFDVYHGATRCLAYKVRCGNSTFVFCTDHELRHGADPSDDRQQRSNEAERRLAEQCQDADLAYFDGQYRRAEYDGLQGIGSGLAICRMDWGHSCIEDVVARGARNYRIKRVVIGHHDPERPWGDRLEIDNSLGKIGKDHAFKIELAKAGDVVDV